MPQDHFRRVLLPSRLSTSQLWLAQNFFLEDMALPLTMTPNYEDFSCQFAFGVQPQPETQDEAFQTACFTQCPSKQPRRQCAGIQVKP